MNVITAEQVDVSKWREMCKAAFAGDKTCNDFLLFLDGCKTQQTNSNDGNNNNSSISWTVVNNKDFTRLFKQLFFINTTNEEELQQQEENTFSVQYSTWLELTEMKRQVRSEWHQQRQVELRQHLKNILNDFESVNNSNNNNNNNGSDSFDDKNQDRVEQVKKYLKTTDLGTVPFLRGLVGFLQFQLHHKDKLAEWHMNEYILTQKNEDAIDRDIALLQQVLGLQLIYKDQDDTAAVVIPMEGQQQQEEELTLVWRMNSALTDENINAILRVLPKDKSNQGYQVSDIQREHQTEGIFQWFYQVLLYCFSFFR